VMCRMPQWLAVVIGVVALVIVGAVPGLYFYDWRFLQQPHATQSQRPPAEHRPANTENNNGNTKDQPAKTPEPIPTLTADKVPAPNLQQQTAEHRGADLSNKDGEIGNLSAWATFGATVGLLIVAGIQAAIYRRQARIMRAQFQSMVRSARSTEKAANAASASAGAAILQARAALGVELPRFIVREALLTDADDTVFKALHGPHVIVTIVNHGRTSARIIEHFITIRVYTQIPDRPNYSSPTPAPIGTILPQGDENPYRIEWRRNSFSRSQIARVISSELTAWMYGYVKYRDFFNDAHITGFCFRLVLEPIRYEGVPPQAHFIEDGPSTYIYTTKETGSDKPT
jgi:hypothetical protein